MEMNPMATENTHTNTQKCKHTLTAQSQTQKHTQTLSQSHTTTHTHLCCFLPPTHTLCIHTRTRTLTLRHTCTSTLPPTRVGLEPLAGNGLPDEVVLQEAGGLLGDLHGGQRALLPGVDDLTHGVGVWRARRGGAGGWGRN